MANIDLNLTARVEDVREPQRAVSPVHFELAEIKKHFDESLTGIEKQGKTAAKLLENGQEEECQDIWRSQIVFLEGVLDFFLHEISKYALFQMFQGNWEKSEKYFGIKGPMRQVENAYADLSTKEWFFSFLNQDMSKQVYLSAESMNEQLNLIGIPFNAVMGKAFPKDTINESTHYGRQVVKEMFERRNKIAHQNDRDHASADRTEITLELVNTYKQQIVSIAEAIYDIAAEK